jgi:hypothetical protein
VRRALCLLWAGVVVGISFIEAPVKFQAPTLTLPVALDVGRHVFHASHVVQLALAALVLAAAARARAWAVVVPVAILAAQHLWLLPVLDARAAAVIAGRAPEGGSPHAIYVALECVKLAGLLAAGLVGRNAAARPAYDRARRTRMSTKTWLAAMTFLGAGCMSAAQRAPNEAKETAEYELTFTSTWTAQRHPLEYPEAGAFSGPHFSGLIGATHDGGYHLIREGEMPTPGLERLSEEGKHSPLDDEIKQQIAAGRAGALFETGPVKDFSMPVTARFKADANHPMVSFVAMIAPSPDWFTGAADVSLHENGAWVSERTIELVAWDSGGDDGMTYKADDRDTSPKKPTMKSGAPHFQQNGTPVPVARVTIRKI